MEALRKNQPMIVFCIQLREAQNVTQVRTDIDISFENKMAEREGFEPSMGYKPMPVFKTGAFNRSATSPHKTRRSELY